MRPFPSMPDDLPRCHRRGCDRVLTVASPSEFFCSASCAQAWHSAGHLELPLTGSNSRVLTDRQHASDHDLSMAFGWLDARV